MNPTLPRSLIMLSLLLACVAASLHAQARTSFDPSVVGACEKALGKSPASDWVGDKRAWELQCGELDLRIENSELASLRKANADKGQPEWKAFDALTAAFFSYRAIQLKLDSIVCGGGNSCGSENSIEQARLTYQFLIMAHGFKDAAIPSYSASDAAASDDALNAAYKRALASYPLKCSESGDGSDDSCASQSLFRSTERAWLRYRDAWLTYGALAWPEISADTWRTYLTLQRTKQL